MYPVIIEQIEGAYRRRVDLERSALPEEEFAHEIGLRFTRTNYPGSSQPSIQILGTEDKPIVLTGLFDDAEQGVDGFADAGRAAIQALERDARRVRLLYRAISLDCLIARTVFKERDAHRIRYEIELEVLGPSGTPIVRVSRDRFSWLNELANQLGNLDTVYEQLPEEMREPPPEWELDPWLEFRLKAAEIHERMETLLKLVGNEAALNANDRIESAARAGYTATQLGKATLESGSQNGAAGLADNLTQSRTIYGMQGSMDSLGSAASL